MAETMVERVARAMCCGSREADDLEGGPHPGGIWLDKGEPWWTGYEEQAIAAIAAMREPTEAMHDAGERIIDNQGCAHDRPTPTLRNAYRAMIDAALAPALQDEESALPPHGGCCGRGARCSRTETHRQ